MRLKVPLTGTVLDYEILAAQHDGIGVVGDPNDPIKPIDIIPVNVSWRLVTIDLENDLAEIEVSPSDRITELKAGGNPDNPKDWTSRPTTPTEKQGFLGNAKTLVEGHTKDELYTMTKAERLVKSAEVVRKYRDNPPNVAAREQLLKGSQ